MKNFNLKCDVAHRSDGRHHISMFRSPIFKTVTFSPVFLIAIVLVTGCSHAEFDLVQPPEIAQHVGTKSDAIIPRPPLEYRLRAIENRLVMQIYNASHDATVQLLGDRSTVVDPNGQSHPIRSQSIAPQSFIKLILPPYRPTIERTGPTIGFGVGVVGDRRGYRREYVEDQSYYNDEPRYYTVVDGDALYWNWDGETPARLLLTFNRGSETFTHEFVIQRVKV